MQTFAQMVDRIVTGRKRSIRRYAAHPVLREFDQVFERTKDALLADKLGYHARQRRVILCDRALRRDLARMRVILRLFEMVKSQKGIYKIEDDITADALFCVRDILRELPRHCLRIDTDMDSERFIDIMRSEYAGPDEILLTPTRRRRIREFQRLYRGLARAVAARHGRSPRAGLQGMASRTALIDRYGG